MYHTIPQEAVSLASFLLIITCLAAAILLRKEFHGKEEHRYLLAFYIAALVYFFTVDSPIRNEAEFHPLLFLVNGISGALMTFLVPAFICQKEGVSSTFRILCLLLVLNIGGVLLNILPVVLPMVFAITFNIIGIFESIKHRRSIAGSGLVACLVVFTSMLTVILFRVPMDIKPEDFYQQLYLLILIFFPAYICGITVFIFLGYMFEVNAVLKLQATTDALTGLCNRNRAFQKMRQFINRLEKQNTNASLIMMDIDRFKKVNDTHGHVIGDKAIKHFASIVQQEVRDYDIAARYGGEEFLIFLRNTDEKEALQIAERIRTKLQGTPVPIKDILLNITSSFGVHQWCKSMSLEKNIAMADKALYYAKEQGRNRTICSDMVLELSS